MATIYDLYNHEPTTRETIAGYYAFRGLKWPGAAEALLFLTTEIVELWDAMTDSSTIDIPDDLMPTYYSLRQARNEIEQYLRCDGGFIRNNQPAGSVDLPGEVGDVRMMLEVLTMTAHLPDAETCMIGKMRKKGYQETGHTPPGSV